MQNTTGRLAHTLQPQVRKREFWAWAMYDFANSGYTTVVLTSVFGAYFVGVVAEGAAWGTLAWTLTLSLSYLLIMLSMPALGAWVDRRARKRFLLFASTVGCVVGTLFLAGAGPGALWWAMVFLVLSNYCYCVGEAVVASFLPTIAKPGALGRVSGWGWGFGYFGGMLTLGLSLFVVVMGEDKGWLASQYVPWVMVLTAAVFSVAAIPAFLWLKEPAAATETIASHNWFAHIRRAYIESREHFPDLYRLLCCCACYQAGISVVITLSSVYATQVMGFNMGQTMMLIFTVNIAAAIGALTFGSVQDAIGHKIALTLTLFGWLVMVVVASVTTSVTGFWIAAALAGVCIGSSQSAGRAMVGGLTPPGRQGEFYALWSFAVQLAAVVGPLSYGIVAWVSQGNQRLALLFTGLFFIVALMWLRQVDFVRGVRQAAHTGD
ncbi:MFS transporter [Paenalcaligenes sp. Me131]|uniref:MFS transporter n=1 Tax=Paenalcaligenes sp. Me131 TaxID=3392636 RepID=UPI003D2CE21E